MHGKTIFVGNICDVEGTCNSKLHHVDEDWEYEFILVRKPIKIDSKATCRSDCVGEAQRVASPNFLVKVPTESLGKEFADPRGDRAVKDLAKCIDQEANEVKIENGDQPYDHHNHKVDLHVAI